MMKKLLSLVLGLLMLPLLTEASSSSQVITLSPWWNVMSTPAVLSSLEFSNGWEWISFSTLKEWSWISVAATTNNIKPLNGFLVYNSNNSDVLLTLNFKENSSPSDKIFQKDLELWWNLVWITTTQDPLKTISPVMEIDITDHLTNKVNSDYSNTIDPELWEAYFVFIDKKDTIYGWVVEQVVQTEQTIQPEEIDYEMVASEVIGYRSSKIKVGSNLSSLAKFKVKSENWWVLKSFVLRSIWEDKLLDKSPLMINVWSLDVDLYNNVTINEDWDIIVSWLNEELRWSYKNINVQVIEHPWNMSLKYKLVKVNNTDADITFATKLIDKLAFVKKQENLWESTLFTFGVEKYRSRYSITWVVLFAWWNVLNDPISSVDNWTELEIQNWSWEQIVDAIWYWCPEWTTNINQCNSYILKSEDDGWLKIWNTDIKVFSL